MAQGLRVILFNTEEDYGVALRRSVLECGGTKIVAEVDEPGVLAQAVQQIPAQLLIVNLDPNPEAILPIAGEVASAHPNLAVFAVSGSTDGQLILSTMRQGLREFLTKPIELETLTQAVQRVVDRSTATGRQGSLVAVVGGAGGVGATTLATNLAVELASMAPGGVCLVDLDYRFGQVGTLLDIEPTYSIADLCETPERLESQVIEKALVKHGSGVHVLCRPPSFSQSDNITAGHCVGALSGLVSMFDYVLVDGPSRYDPGAKAVLDIADGIIVMLELLVPDVRNVQRMLDAMKQAGFNLDRVRLVCNRLGKESSNLSVADVEATLNMEIFAALPDDWPGVSASINLGEPLARSQPRSKVRLAIQELAERLHNGTDDAAEPVGGRKGGILSKIF
jgi:pilus assembly protein CpaE